MDAPLFSPGDFVEYWAAARLHLAGGDPYDGAQLLPLQKELYGKPDLPRAVMLWTPPWTLPLYWPFAALPPAAGHLLWVVVQVLSVLAASVLTWRAYGGPGRLWLLVPVLLAAGLAPTWWMIVYGQNTGFVALGAAGFVWAQARGKPVAAGAFAALTAIKPHLLALFGVVLILDGVAGRSRKSLAAGVAVMAVLAAVALIPDPAVFGQFVAAVASEPTPERVPLSGWAVPTLGHLIRDIAADGLGGMPMHTLFWVQFVPCVLGMLAVVPYWWNRRRAWDWRAEMPGLVLLSLLVAPYGAWIFDLTLLVIPVAAVAARLTTGPLLVAVAGWVALLVASMTTLEPAVVRHLHDMVWFTPVVALVCGAAARFTR